MMLNLKENWKVIRESWTDGIQSLKTSFKLRDWLFIILIIIIVGELYIGTDIIQEEKTILDNSNILPVDDCICLDYNPYDQAIYIGTTGGAFEYRITTEEFNEILNSTNSNFTLTSDISTFSHTFFFSLTQDAWGGVYFCGGSLAGDLDPELLNITGSSSEPERRFSCISSGSLDPLLILGGDGNTLFIYNYSSRVTMKSVECDMLAGANEILRVGLDVFVGANGGLVIYSLDDNSTHEYPIYSSEELIEVKCLEFDEAKSELYLGTSHGVYIYNLQDNNTLQFKDRITEANGILSSDINCLELDTTTERLYIGSPYGVSVYDLLQGKVRRNYANLFPSNYQTVSDIVLARYFGRVRKLFVSSRFNGIAMVDVNNLMSLGEYIPNSYSLLLPLIGIPTTLITIYVTGEKKITRRVVVTLILSVLVLLLSSWLVYLNGVISIPNFIPDLS